MAPAPPAPPDDGDRRDHAARSVALVVVAGFVLPLLHLDPAAESAVAFALLVVYLWASWPYFRRLL